MLMGLHPAVEVVSFVEPDGHGRLVVWSLRHGTLSFIPGFLQISVPTEYIDCTLASNGQTPMWQCPRTQATTQDNQQKMKSKTGLSMCSPSSKVTEGSNLTKCGKVAALEEAINAGEGRAALGWGIPCLHRKSIGHRSHETLVKQIANHYLQ